MEHSALHERARTKGVNPLVYWIVRGIFQSFFHLYFRLSRIGREHVPQDGPVIYAANKADSPKVDPDAFEREIRAWTHS